MERSRRRVGTAVVLVVVFVAGAVAATAPTTPQASTGAPSNDGHAGLPTLDTTAVTPQANGTPARTGLGSGDRVGGVGTPTTLVGPAVAVGDDELRVRFDRYRARGLLAEAETTAQRRAAVRTVLNETRTAVDRLRERERAAARAYHEGAIDRETLFQRLAAVHLVAGEHRRAIAELERRAGGAFTFELRTEASALSRELALFRSPVRERVANGMTGESVPAVSAHATASGLAIETVDDGQYVRDVVRFDRYGPGDGEPLNTTTEVVDRLRVVYPEAFSASSGHSIASVGDRLFRAEFPHPQGSIRTYLNRDTGAVYRELQRLRLDRIETTVAASRSLDGVGVSVERVEGHDPTLVRIDRDTADVGTPDPVGTTVVVDNRTVGTTDDGRLWLLLGSTPANVSVRTPDGTVTVTVGNETPDTAAVSPALPPDGDTPVARGG